MKKFEWMVALTVVLFLAAMLSMIVSTTNTGNIADAVEGTWKTTSPQIKTVANNIVFPAIDLVLTVLFFVKMATAYMDYRKCDRIEWAPATILFVGLVSSLFTPMYVWRIVGAQEVK